MPLMSNSEETCSISLSEWIFFESVWGTRAPDQVDKDELPLEVEDGSSVLLERSLHLVLHEVFEDQSRDEQAHAGRVGGRWLRPMVFFLRRLAPVCPQLSGSGPW